MGERPLGPAALCSFRLSNSVAIPAVVIQMGGIDGARLGVWSKLLHTERYMACED